MSIRIVELVDDIENLVVREQAWMDQFKGRLYNRSPTARSRFGIKERAETAKLKSAALIGNKNRFGIIHDSTSKAKISAGLKRAYEKGRRKKPVGNALHFVTFLNDLKSGKRFHAKHNPQRDRAIVLMHDKTKSLRKTALAFGLSPGHIWIIVRKLNPSQLSRKNSSYVRFSGI